MNTNNMDSKMKKILIFISFCIFAVASCTESYEAHYDFGFDREELRFAAKDKLFFQTFGIIYLCMTYVNLKNTQKK